MNLHIDGQKLRFRLTKAELEKLCNKKNIKQKIFLPEQNIISININIQPQEENLIFTFINNNFHLAVNEWAAKNLYNSLPSKEGIRVEQKIDENNILTLLLEVDIRTQGRIK